MGCLFKRGERGLPVHPSPALAAHLALAGPFAVTAPGPVLGSLLAAVAVGAVTVPVLALAFLAHGAYAVPVLAAVLLAVLDTVTVPIPRPQPGQSGPFLRSSIIIHLLPVLCMGAA